MVKRRQGAGAARARTVRLQAVILDIQQRLSRRGETGRAHRLRHRPRRTSPSSTPPGWSSATSPSPPPSTSPRPCVASPARSRSAWPRALASAPGVRRAEVAGGGYVNLFLDRGTFAGGLVASLAGAAPAAGRRGHVIVEHTSINPNKAAHIGHLRNACLGDTFVRLLRHRGLRRRRAELHRRHRRAGRGRGGRASSTSRGSPSPTSRRSGGSSTTTAGTSTRGWATSTRPTRRERPCRPRPSTPSRRAATTPPASPSTWRGGSWTATSPRWRGSGSATTCSPTRATS